MDNNISKKTLKQFGLLIGIGFPLIIGWIIPLIGGHPFRSWTLFISFPTLILTFLKTNLLHYPYRFWIKLGDLLGFINSHLILGIVYLFILVPISLVMRLFGYDPLRKIKGQKTYRESKEGYQINLERIF